MKIQILGTGCKKCNELYANSLQAIRETNFECEIEKVTEIEKIVAMGVMITPALAVDGKVVSSGKLLTAAEIAEILASHGGKTASPAASAPSSCCCCCSSSGDKEDASRNANANDGEKAPFSCCCSGPKNNFFKKVIAALMFVFVLGSVLYMVDKESRSGKETAPTANVEKNDLKVYYFHGNKRCYTCNKIEELARNAVKDKKGVKFLSINVEEKENEHFVRDFQLVSRCVVMERNGKYEKLEKVWELVGTPDKFTSYILEGVERNSK